IFASAIPQDKEHEQDDAGGKQTGDAEETPVTAGGVERERVGEGGPVIALALDQAEDQGEERTAGEQNAHRIQVLVATQPDSRKQPDAQDERDDADRDIDPEVRLPAEIRNEKAAQRRAGDRGNAGDRTPGPKRRPAPVGGKDVRQDTERLRGQNRAADALDDAGQNKLARTLGEAATDRGEGEDRQANEEESLGAVFVAQSSGGDQQHGIDEDVRVQHPEDLVEAGVESIDDARNGDVDDRQIEQDHEEAKAENEQDDPRTAFGLDGRLHRESV